MAIKIETNEKIVAVEYKSPLSDADLRQLFQGEYVNIQIGPVIFSCKDQYIQYDLEPGQRDEFNRIASIYIRGKVYGPVYVFTPSELVQLPKEFENSDLYNTYSQRELEDSIIASIFMKLSSFDVNYWKNIDDVEGEFEYRLGIVLGIEDDPNYNERTIDNAHGYVEDMQESVNKPQGNRNAKRKLAKEPGAAVDKNSLLTGQLTGEQIQWLIDNFDNMKIDNNMNFVIFGEKKKPLCIFEKSHDKKTTITNIINSFEIREEYEKCAVLFNMLQDVSIA